MSSTKLYRLSGIALLVGSLLCLLSSILDAILFPGHSNTPQQILSAPWLLSESIFLAGIILVVVGLPGFYQRQATRVGGLGFAGFVLVWLAALVTGLAFTALRLTMFPYLARLDPKLITDNPPITVFLLLILAPGLLLNIGNILLGIATIRARVFPRWIGILFLISGIISLLSLGLPPAPISDIIEPFGDFTFFLALAWSGYALVAQRGEAVESEQLIAPTFQTSR